MGSGDLDENYEVSIRRVSGFPVFVAASRGERLEEIRRRRRNEISLNENSPVRSVARGARESVGSRDGVASSRNLCALRILVAARHTYAKQPSNRPPLLRTIKPPFRRFYRRHRDIERSDVIKRITVDRKHFAEPFLVSTFRIFCNALYEGLTETPVSVLQSAVYNSAN